MKKILAVCDSEGSYVNRFMDYFMNKDDFYFDVCVFTKTECLKAYCMLHKIEILLLGQSVQCDQEILTSVTYFCYLSEDRTADKESGQPVIFKYQSVASLLDELLSNYAKSTESRITVPIGKTKIITIFTLYQNMEAYHYAWSLALQLSRQSKTLLVPLELLPVSGLSFPPSPGQALSDFIYYLKENQNIITKMKSYLQYSTNLAYLSGILHAFDLLSLSGEDLNRWVSEIRLNTDYNSVVFYLSFYNEAAAEMLRLSDEIHLTSSHSSYENALMKTWESQMERLGIPVGDDKYHKIFLSQNRMEIKMYHTILELSESVPWREAAKYLA